MDRSEEVKQEIERVEYLYKNGIIDKSDYERKKAELISEIEAFASTEKSVSPEPIKENLVNTDEAPTQVKAETMKNTSPSIAMWSWIIAAAGCYMLFSFMFGHGSNKVDETEVTVSTTKAASPNAVSNGYGKFKRNVDDFDGAQKMLSYVLFTEDYEQSISILCVNSNQFLVLLNTGLENPVRMDTAVTIRAKIDDDNSKTIDFTSIAGYKSFIPGAPPEAENVSVDSAENVDHNTYNSLQFLRYLKGHKKLVLKVEAFMGITVEERPSIYDITGIDAVISDVMKTCGMNL